MARGPVFDARSSFGRHRPAARRALFDQVINWIQQALMTFTCGAVERSKIFLPTECVSKWETVIEDSEQASKWTIFLNHLRVPWRRLPSRLPARLEDAAAKKRRGRSWSWDRSCDRWSLHFARTPFQEGLVDFNALCKRTVRLSTERTAQWNLI